MGDGGVKGLGGIGAGVGAGAAAVGADGTIGAGATRIDSIGDCARPMCSARGGAWTRGAGDTFIPGCMGEGMVATAGWLCPGPCDALRTGGRP